MRKTISRQAATLVAMLALAPVSLRAAPTGEQIRGDGEEVPLDLDDLDAPLGNIPQEAEQAAAEEVPISLDDLDDPAPPNPTDKEAPVLLDALDGEKDAPTERYLPVSTESIEAAQNPTFLLAVLGVLAPLGAMLLPPGRRKRSSTRRAPWEVVSQPLKRKETVEK